MTGMDHPFIVWTKSYELEYSDGKFNIFISEHQSGCFYGVIIYYVPGDYNRQEYFPDFEYKLMQFVDVTEQSVYEQCIRWADQCFEGKFSISVK